ncbi:MAG: hypothetical protein MJA32_01940 [Proteobacteria bacterium]|nr:hypothetical protein [Pseudomonadota bacterium]
MTDRDEEAAEELTRFARSGRRGAGKKAGEMYQFATLLTRRRAGSLPRLGRGNPDIRWWDFGDMTIYFRVSPPPIKVVKVSMTKTVHQRDECEQDAHRVTMYYICA